MKMNQSSILLFGHDEYLLATRQWVLQSRGYRVLTTTNLARIDTIAAMPPIKLLVLCHSLSPAEIAEATARAAARWPEIQLLELMADGGRVPAGILGQLLHTMDGPAKLVSMVENLVGHAAAAAPTQKSNLSAAS